MVGSGEDSRGGPVSDRTRTEARRRRLGRSVVPLTDSSWPERLAPGPLLASLTHELRTPVSALATGSELLLEDLDSLSREDLHRIVQAVHRGAMWLQGLVENVLFAATVAEGAVRLYLRPISLVELVRDVVPVMEPLLRQRSQRIRIIDREGQALVSADSRRIGQVLINLIGNASKYSGPGTVIDVRVSRLRSGVRLSVCDRGPGLPAGSADALFVRHVRGPAAKAGGVEGNGLGLAIVRSIAHLHGGSAGASRRRGGGAQFWVDLPMAEAGSGADAGTGADQLVRERLA